MKEERREGAGGRKKMSKERKKWRERNGERGMKRKKGRREGLQEGQVVGEVRSDDRRMRLVVAMMKTHSTTDQNMSYCNIQMCLNVPLKIILYHIALFRFISSPNFENSEVFSGNFSRNLHIIGRYFEG